MGWEPQTAGLSYLTAETMMATEAVHVCMHDVKMGVLLSDHKVVFVSAGVAATQGSDGEWKPLILSVVHGLQLVGVQLCSTPAQVNQVCTTTPLYAVWQICAVLWSRGGGRTPPIWWQRGWSVLLKRFFFFFWEHTPNDRLGWGLSTGQAQLNLMWQCGKFTSKH